MSSTAITGCIPSTAHPSTSNQRFTLSSIDPVHGGCGPVFRGVPSEPCSATLLLVNVSNQRVLFKLKTNRPTQITVLPMSLGLLEANSEVHLLLLWCPNSSDDTADADSQTPTRLLLQTTFVPDTHATHNTIIQLTKVTQQLVQQPNDRVSMAIMRHLWQDYHEAHMADVCGNRLHLSFAPNNDSTKRQHGNTKCEILLDRKFSGQSALPKWPAIPSKNNNNNNKNLNNINDINRQLDYTSYRYDPTSPDSGGTGRVRVSSTTECLLGALIVALIAVIMFWSMHICVHFSVQIPK